jgi:hypothetical protein
MRKGKKLRTRRRELLGELRHGIAYSLTQTAREGGRIAAVSARLVCEKLDVSQEKKGRLARRRKVQKSYRHTLLLQDLEFARNAPLERKTVCLCCRR